MIPNIMNESKLSNIDFTNLNTQDSYLCTIVVHAIDMENNHQTSTDTACLASKENKSLIEELVPYLKDQGIIITFKNNTHFVYINVELNNLNLDPKLIAISTIYDIYIDASKHFNSFLPDDVIHDFFYYESGIFERINDYYENKMSDNDRRAIDLIFSTLKEKGVAISDEGFIDTNGHEEHTICFDFVNN